MYCSKCGLDGEKSALLRSKEESTSEIAALRVALQEAVEIYKKYDALINPPNNPGEWIEKARKALKTCRGEK